MSRNGSGRNRNLLISGAIVGFSYGLLIRFGAQLHLPEWTSVMSLAFLVFLPFAMGFLTIFVVERQRPQPFTIWVLLPWLPVLGASLATILALGRVHLRDHVCADRVVLRESWRRLGRVGDTNSKIPDHQESCLAVVVLMPLLTTSWLRNLLGRRDLRTVENVIVIQAPAASVWKNIERVPRIEHEELKSSWSHDIGFPSPVEATLSFEGSGSVRHATFEHGVLFIENVDVWEPERRLALSIHAQTDQIPSTTLDEQVRVGGPFFDVLRGEYRLETLPGGAICLHLSSQHRLSTDFNWYAHLWTDAVMADLQETILHVIQKRCEAESSRK